MSSIVRVPRSIRLGNGRAIGYVPQLKPFQLVQLVSVADVAGPFGMPGACAEAITAARSLVIVSNAIPT